MPKKHESVVPTHFRAKRVEGVVYYKQGQDYVPPIEMEVGSYQLPNGKPGWTTFKVWCYAPNYHHPEFTIKIGINNKDSAYTAVTITEFDTIIQRLIQWRTQHTNEFQTALDQSNILQARKPLMEKFESRISDYTSSVSDISDLLAQDTTSSPESAAYIRRQNIIRLLNDYKSQDNPSVKSYIGIQLSYLLPHVPNLHQLLDKFFSQTTQTQSEDTIDFLLNREIEALQFNPPEGVDKSPEICYNNDNPDESGLMENEPSATNE